MDKNRSTHVAAGGEFEQIKEMVESIQGLRNEYETQVKPFEIHATGKSAYSHEGIKSLGDIGVDMVFVGFPFERATRSECICSAKWCFWSLWV